MDLLYWLGVMFDTLSTAMHKRPLVISDEDSDIHANLAVKSDRMHCHELSDYFPFYQETATSMDDHKPPETPVL